jgi:hypothetical protein
MQLNKNEKHLIQMISYTLFNLIIANYNPLLRQMNNRLLHNNRHDKHRLKQLLSYNI